jgi:hypothetical protein
VGCVAVCVCQLEQICRECVSMHTHTFPYLRHCSPHTNCVILAHGHGVGVIARRHSHTYGLELTVWGGNWLAWTPTVQLTVQRCAHARVDC